VRVYRIMRGPRAVRAIKNPPENAEFFGIRADNWKVSHASATSETSAARVKQCNSGEIRWQKNIAPITNAAI
jgi:hypothetical protein